MELFEFVDVLFKRPQKYKELKDTDKAKHFYMVQRFMSIQYAAVADKFNHLRVSQAKVMDYWHFQMSKVYKTVPGWMYTKTKKKKTEDKKEIKWPSDDAIKLYLDRTGRSRRELQDAVDMFGQDALNPVFGLEKLMKADK